MEKIKRFIKAHSDYLILSGIVIGLCVMCFIIGGVFPFGNNTFGTYDWYHQGIDLTANIYNIFGGRTNGIFTFDFASGSTLFANIAYMCLSPFSLLLVIAGAGNVRYMYPIVFVLKLIVIACVMYYFIRKYFPKVSNKIAIFITLAYTFSGFMYLTSTFPVWLDYMIYMPLLFMAFKHMESTGQIRYLTAISVFIITTCFSLGIFTLLYMTFIFFAYVSLCIAKGKRARMFTKYLLSMAIAIFSTLIITVPSLLQVFNGSRADGLISALLNNDLFRNISYKIGHLLPDMVLITLCIIYFCKEKLKNNTNKFYFICFILMLLPVVFDEINLIINFSNYAMYCNRLGFLYTFVFTFIALKFCEKYIKFRKDKTKTNILLNIVLGFTLAIFAFLVWYFGKELSLNIVTQGFSWKLVLFIVGILSPIWLAIGLVLLARKLKLVGSEQLKKLLITCFCALLIGQPIMYLNHNTQIIGAENNYSNYSNIITAEDKYSRVKSSLVSGQLSRGYASLSGFSSLIDANTIDAYTMLGYSDNSHHISNNANTIFADMLSGLDWEISNKELDVPYLTLAQSNGSSYLYKNTLSLGHAYYVDELPNCSLKNDFITNQNIIYKALSGDTEELITRLDYNEINKNNFTFTDLRLQKVEDKIKVTIIGDEPTITFNYTNNKGHNQLVYLLIDTNGAVYNVADSNLTNKTKLKSLELIDYLEKSNDGNYNSTSISVTLNASELDDLAGYVLNYDKLIALHQKLTTNLPQVKFTNDSIVVDVTNNINKYLIINHPMITGYTYSLNGAKANPNNFVNMPAFNIEGISTTTIKLEYSYPYLDAFLISFIVGALVVAILLICALYYDNIMTKFEKVITIGYTSGVGVLSVIYFAIPLLLFVYKIIKLIFGF